MFCGYCGSSIESGSKFCPNCGAEIPLPKESGSENHQTGSDSGTSYAGTSYTGTSYTGSDDGYRKDDWQYSSGYDTADTGGNSFEQEEYSDAWNDSEMSFTDAIKTCFAKYVDFNGRARRREYWYFCLLNIAVILVLRWTGWKTFSSFYSLAVFLPGLAVAVRRLHDIGKSGLNLLILLIPIVGAVIVLIWEITDSEPGRNQYGPNPKGVTKKDIY